LDDEVNDFNTVYAALQDRWHDQSVDEVMDEALSALFRIESEVHDLRGALEEIVVYVDDSQGNRTPNPDHMQSIASVALRKWEH
jgi:hypothetical protein